jgi:carbamate kinase
MRIVAALGGNALLERGEAPDASVQQHHVLCAIDALAPLCREHEVIITHGNGPQVGVLSLESDVDPALSEGYPLDVLGAETQGMIGYWLLQALENALPGREVAALVCQTEVSAFDPAFATPTKFVGQAYSREQAEVLANERSWTIRPDGEIWRRVVASPVPQSIVELPVIEQLLGRGVTVICSGGGGIPVVRGSDGSISGVEAVIDKDRAAALLARLIGADALLLLTDVEAVETDYGTVHARPIGRISVAALRDLSFPSGSMGPKVEAACDFVELTGMHAAIGRLGDAAGLLASTAGTTIEALA